MKSLVVVPGTPGIRAVETPEPTVKADTHVKLRVLHVGICGTDREETAGGRSLPPDGSQSLVIGHEMLGQVVEAGDAVTKVAPGDLAVFTVRRGCSQCISCTVDRSDMCDTGEYQERGIWGLDGYQGEYAVDDERYLVPVPSALGAAAVLTEPLSVAEKAIDEAVRIQEARLPEAAASSSWLEGRTCIVAGLGPVGLLGALALRLRGAEVWGLDVVDPNSARPKWLEAIGGHYVNDRTLEPGRFAEVLPQASLLFEAAGIPSLTMNLLDALDRNGAYVLTGIPSGDRPLQIHGAEITRRLVLNNQVMVGSVNASRAHFQMAVDDLLRSKFLSLGSVDALVTHRVPHDRFEDAFQRHPDDAIKMVIEWNPPPAP